MLDIQQLVHNVRLGAPEDQAASAALLRVMTRHGFKHSKKVYEADAVEPLIDLMLAEDEPTVEHAVTTILNLSLDDRLKTKIGDKEGLYPQHRACAQQRNAPGTSAAYQPLPDYPLRKAHYLARSAALGQARCDQIRARRWHS